MSSDTIAILIKKPMTIEDLLWNPKYMTNKLSLSALRIELLKKRNIWETITRRNQHIEDDLIKNGSKKDLKARLDWYESEEAYVTLTPWLVKFVKRLLLDQKKQSQCN